MKKLYLLHLLLFAFIVSLAGQKPSSEQNIMPKDSLPNLWIVTIDMSGSMRDREQTTGHLIYQRIHEKVECALQDNGAMPTDKIVFLKSGIDKTLLLSSIKENATLPYFKTRRTDGTYPQYRYREICFPTSFVRLLKDATIMPQGMSYLKSLCADGTGFDASLSFTSLIRPLSIFILTKNGKSFIEYNKVYHVLVTDDGDVNDQWNQDYQYLKKYTRPHFDSVCAILPKVACSNFDFASKQTAKFEEVCPPYDSTQPRIYLTQYITYQEKHPEKTLTTESLVSVSDFHDNRLALSMKPCGDSIAFVYINTCCVNGHPIPVNQYLYLYDTIPVAYDTACTNTFRNKVSVEGTYQEQYNDRILGQRYRKVVFGGELAGNFVTAETRHAEHRFLGYLIGLLLLILVLIIIWRELPVLRIFVNGKSYCITKKAMNRLKNDDFTLVTIAFDGDTSYETFFYKDRGITVKDDFDSTTSVGDGKLFISSPLRGLSPNYSNFIFDPDQSGKHINITFDGGNVGDTIQFCYADGLSHNLVIRCEEKEYIKSEKRKYTEHKKPCENDLRDCNLKMLARYYEQKADVISSVCNNVQVNIIRGGDKYKEDYAILNIFNLNGSNTANHIFLRFSLMCFYDGKQKSDKTAAEQLLQVANHVLHSEHQKEGYKEGVAYTSIPQGKTSVVVEVSPLLSYLYLLTKGKNRLAYSPFVDGHYGLSSKVVKIFPKETMTLLNLPFRYNNPEMKINGPTKVVLEKCYRENEAMTFLGNDIVKFLNVEKDWSSGMQVNAVDGVTYSSWSLDEIINDIGK